MLLFKDIVENTADQGHFNSIHGSANIIPKYLQRIIKFNLVIVNPWKVDVPPNTNCGTSKVNILFKLVGFIELKLDMPFIQIGPALLSANGDINIYGIKFNFTLTMNVITLGPLRQIMCFKLYTKPTILNYIFVKLMLKCLPYFVSIY